MEADRLLHPQDGNRTWLHAEIGDLCAAMGDPNRAKVELERAVDLHPGNVRAAEALARLDRGDADWLEVRCPDAVKKAARAIPGWLASEEMDLLAACVDRAPSLERRQTGAVLELGSYCGRSTVVIAGALRRSRRSDLRFSAVDPHEGTEPGGESTLESLLCSLRDLSLERWASVIVGRSQEVAWRSPIAFLFIDAMHDYQNVSADFRRFSEYVVTGGLVAFHDYSRYFPDVRRLVDEVLLERDFRFVAQRGHLLVIRRVNPRPSS